MWLSFSFSFSHFFQQHTGSICQQSGLFFYWLSTWSWFESSHLPPSWKTRSSLHFPQFQFWLNHIWIRFKWLLRFPWFFFSISIALELHFKWLEFPEIDKRLRFNGIRSMAFWNYGYFNLVIWRIFVFKIRLFLVFIKSLF